MTRKSPQTANGKSPKPSIEAQPGYRHKEGSRKSKVHQLYDEQGAEAAWVLGAKLKLKEGTLRTWLATWRRLDEAEKKSAKKSKSNSAAAVAPKPNDGAFLAA